MNIKIPSMLLFATVLVSSAVVACPACDDSKKSAAAAPTEIRTLTPEQVQEWQASRGVHVFDANPRDIFDKHHVPGAVHIEYDQITASQLPADQLAAVVFYCMNERCGASPIAARRAIELGWRDVYLMPAGIQGWLAARLPIEAKTNPATN